ncbi:prepilin peptidase [uncultured Bifidobacterium sp.]|uniref:prepilin peptidase n=1 Tax=uncultured Bifidobacterium sp. TaxID=165187 RepID=UPI0028DBBCF6|nr:prepilin peptidase [uncultured Bifidobacterium sp.]
MVITASPSLQTDVTTFVLAIVGMVVVGGLFGSFLNVVIWRVPNHISLVDPKRSFCPRCGAPIAWYDNIPLVSYAVLHARCRHCHEPISIRYPLVEALGGVMAGAVTAGALLGMYPGWMLPDLYLLAAVSIVIAFIDLDHHLILNVIVYPTAVVSLLLLVLASWGTGEWTALGRAVLAGVILGAFYLLLAFIWPGGMGLGDVKLAAVLGLTLGWLGWPQLVVGAFAAFLIGGVVGVALIAARKVELRGGIPFGPSMVVGAWVGIAAGAPLAAWYLHLAGIG